MLSNDERDAIRRMDDDDFQRQQSLEILGLLRVLGNQYGGFRETLGQSSSVLDCDNLAGLRELPEFERVRDDAGLVLANLNRFQASLARLVEVAEAKIGTEDLIEPPPMTAEQRMERAEDINRLVEEREESRGEDPQS
jgi:hypothetical protein